MSVANLKNVFSNQGAAPLKAPGTSFLHGNKVNGAGIPVQSNVNTESKNNSRWGSTSNNGNNTFSNNNSITNLTSNGFGNSDNKFQNGSKVPTPHPPLEKRQSSEHFGVTLKRVSLGESNAPENKSFLHNNGPASPPLTKTPVSPPANKSSLFKVVDNTKFAKAQQEKSPVIPSNSYNAADSGSLKKLTVERTVSDGSPLTNGFHGATANKSNLFGSVVKPANAPGTLKTPFSRANLNKVNSTDETDSIKTNAMSPTSKFGQTSSNTTSSVSNGASPTPKFGQTSPNTPSSVSNGATPTSKFGQTSPNSIPNGIKNPPRTEAIESKITATKTIGTALSPRAKPADLKFSSPTSPAFPAKPSPQVARKGSDASPTSNVSADRLRLKFEDSEKKRKALIGENQKVQRDLAELDRKFEQLKRDHDNTKKELTKKDQQLNHLRNLSEGVYKEYDQLKNQHEMEISTMRKAMDRASRWYKENKELKRKSSVLIQRVKKEVPHLHQPDDELDSATGSGDDQDSETQDLRNTVSELTREVSCLQSSLSTAKQREFDAQESVVELQTSLEEERRSRQKAEFSLKELEAKHANLDKVSRLVAAEVQNLNDKFERERKQSQAIRQQADQAKKERNVLAHQSQLLMLEAMADERFMQLLTEIESLKSQLEDEQNRHETEMQNLQEKLDERETEPYVEILEEKLKVVENELSIASEKCERAERRIEELEAGGGGFGGPPSAPRPPGPPPPPPPPGNMPPPPPPPPLPSGPAMGSGPGLNLRGVTLKRRESTAVMDMANLLGINPKDKANGKPTPQGGAIDDIINQLKEGKFTLKPAEKKTAHKEEEKEEPAPMKELMNVLGTLKKRPKKRDSEPNVTADSA